jgi:predicted nucleic acid-binding protein
VIVVDASVVCKWFLPEAGTERALVLLDGPLELVAPAVIRLEVAGAITRRQRLGECDDAEARFLCDTWSERLGQGAVTLLPDDELLGRAVALAVELRHALADCLYLAAAELRGVPLVTADATFRKRAAAHYPDIHLLSRWQAN